MAVQIPLGLKEYPRPIAWTLSEVERATGYRDRSSMLFTAFEEVTRFLVWMQLARYGEYWLEGKRDTSVDKHVAALRRPSFGHYVQALLALDTCLQSHSDAFAIGMKQSVQAPCARALLAEVGRSATPTKKVTHHMLLSKVVHLRNREKGHGYTGEGQAQTLTELLEPALREFLEAAPQLTERPLVWVEHIEFIDSDRSVITYLKLMGTRRPSRHVTEVRSPGALRRGSLFLWDEDTAPLQVSPYLHLERGQHDEKVFVLAAFAGEPTYQSRGGKASTKRPDRLIEQFEARAPFLLDDDGGVTTARRPDGDGFYRSAVELALADGRVTSAEAEKLDAIRRTLGLSETEAAAVHEQLGWVRDAAPTAAPANEVEAPKPSLRGFLVGLRERLLHLEPKLHDEVEINHGELWLGVGEAQGVSIWFPRKRGDRVQLAVGFYSRHKRRDPIYRAARARLENDAPLRVPAGWKGWTHKSRCDELAWETKCMVALERLTDGAFADETARFATELHAHAIKPAPPQEPIAREAEGVAQFELRRLENKPRIRGSVWIARILWALERGARDDQGPMTAADIARVLCAHGVQVPSTNTARAFRVQRDDPRHEGLCDEPAPQRYVINEAGRAELRRLLRSSQTRPRCEDG